jgi:hypothetical protein
MEVLSCLGPTLDEALDDAIIRQLDYYMGEVSTDDQSDDDLKSAVLARLHTAEL